jgi:hypothetical protein
VALRAEFVAGESEEGGQLEKMVGNKGILGNFRLSLNSLHSRNPRSTTVNSFTSSNTATLTKPQTLTMLPRKSKNRLKTLAKTSASKTTATLC